MTPDSGRRGFYFSFDALIALTLLGLTTVILLGTSAPVQQAGDRAVQTFRQANTLAEDAAQAASHSTLQQAFDQETVDDYVNDTALDDEDRKKSVLDVITILWASNETAAAANLSAAFFDGIVPPGYGYSVSIAGEGEDLVFNSSRLNGSAEAAANAKRVVSGVQKNQPQQGYLSRARATRVDKNTTEVFGMPMAGSAVKSGDSHSLDLNRSFHLDAEDIQNATLYLSMETGGSDPNSITVRVNGQDAGFPDTWDYEVDKSGNKLLFHKEQVTALLNSGWNSVYVSAKNTGGGNDVDASVHLNPGSRMEVTYSSNATGNLTTRFSDRKYFTNVETVGHQNTNHGAWSVMSYYVPETAEVTNVTLNLHAQDVDEVADRNETQVYVNDQLVNATPLCTAQAPGQCDGEQEVQFRYNLTNATEPGTNVVAVYLDTFLNENGRIEAFGDDDRIELFSEPASSPSTSSYLEYAYERSRANLVFGKIRLSRTERFGGSRSNPKAYNTTFNPDVSLLDTFVHLAQLDSENVSVTVEDGEKRTAFTSPRDFATPTDLFIHPNYYDTSDGVNNTVTVSDDCTVECSILPETTFERTLLITSQVPYGGTFQNRSAAQEDAEQRLNETLGEFVDATEIASDTLSVNDVPWLFGPVTFELEVWKQ